MANVDRRSTFKTPPRTFTDISLSQEARRTKALEEQKRRRALKLEAARQFDRFADLNLTLGEGDLEEAVPVPRTIDGVATFVPFLEMSGSEQGATFPFSDPLASLPVQRKAKSKRKPKSKNPSEPKVSRWADKCMYAELLEMCPDQPGNCGLPDDLETGWVAVGPVPTGKRCLAVTHQSAGKAGVVPNTTLHSRLLGKSLIRPFPSSLPPSTILDCILDENWRDNGILHILDCIKWKERDVGDCETAFRLWWRDTRLGELAPTPPPARSARQPFASDAPPTAAAMSSLLPTPPSSQVSVCESYSYQFPYPITLLPIPYYTPTPLSLLASQIIPLARSAREVHFEVPVIRSLDSGKPDMEMDGAESYSTVSRTSSLSSDGLLLYVAQAAYEYGTSPLSSWIPIRSPPSDEAGLDGPSVEGPLDMFERLVHRRMALIGDRNDAEEFVKGMDVD